MGDCKLDISKAFSSKPSRTIRVKILGIRKQYEDETINIFLKKTYQTVFSYYQNRQKSTFLPFAKNLSDRFNYLLLYMIIFFAQGKS